MYIGRLKWTRGTRESGLGANNSARKGPQLQTALTTNSSILFMIQLKVRCLLFEALLSLNRSSFSLITSWIKINILIRRFYISDVVRLKTRGSNHTPIFIKFEKQQNPRQPSPYLVAHQLEVFVLTWA